MWTQPTTQQRPEPLHCIHMHFTKPVTIFITGVLTPTVIDTLMAVSPGLQARINAVLIRINKCARNNGVFDKRLDSLLLTLDRRLITT